jgi:hypothetical protein
MKIVNDFGNSITRLGQQNSQAASIRFDVMGVARHELD